VPVARWIKQQIGGRTKLVHIGRPWGRLAWFDLVFAMPQYDLPDRPNVFQARMPFNVVTPDAAARSIAAWQARLSDKPRPWLAVLVGGDARPLELDAGIGLELGMRVAARARATGGTVLLSTSRRSPKDAVDAIVEQLGPRAVVYHWRPDDPNNPYAAFLALADEIVVTGDSASMLAEALRSGKPVNVMPLAYRPDWRRQLVDRLRRVLPAAWFELLVDLGLVASTRDLRRLHRRLQDEGVTGAPGLDPGKFAKLADDLPLAAQRLRSLVAGTAR
jgi:mitochondrial fission protein ELM1